jgi:hypothetical protein
VLFNLKILEHNQLSALGSSHNPVIIEPSVVSIVKSLRNFLKLRDHFERAFFEQPDLPVLWP